MQDHGIVTFRISKRAIRVTLAHLPRHVHPEAADALEEGLKSPIDPVEVRLEDARAKEWLHWLKSAAYRHTKDDTPYARLLVEVADSLEFALNSLS